MLMLVFARDNLQFSTDLHRAIQQQEFTLYYQPVVDADTQAIRGFEALIRWLHPERGTVSPAIFISIAEESELILDIGWWVMETACLQMHHWLAQYGDYFQRVETVTMSINFSSKQFFAVDCLEKILAILFATGGAPHHIKL